LSPPSAGVPVYRALCEESATESPQYRSTSWTPPIVRALLIDASQHRNSACHKPPTEWQLVVGDLTRSEAQIFCHHRDGSVQNAITYLCISPSSHDYSKDAIRSERLVLRRWNRAIETKPDVSPMPTLCYQGSPCKSTMERLSEPTPKPP
jgi:hypothetical protein